MIRFFEILSFLLAWGYTAIFFLILKSFLPLRKNVVLKVIAFLICGYLADSIIYSNDAGSLFGTMFLFFLYVLLFYRGTFMEKLSVMLVFYPALIAINYLMLDTGVRLFKIVTQASYEEALQSSTLMLPVQPFIRCPFCCGYCSGSVHGWFCGGFWKKFRPI